MSEMGFMYVLECRDGSLYCGSTNDFDRRMGEHRSGKGSKYVRSRLPFKIAFVREYKCPMALDMARSDERAFKRLTRKQKLEYIKM